MLTRTTPLTYTTQHNTHVTQQHTHTHTTTTTTTSRYQNGCTHAINSVLVYNTYTMVVTG